MRYEIEPVYAESRIPTAHRHEIALRCGVATPRYAFDKNKILSDSTVESGGGDRMTHAVVDTTAHPLNKIVAYATRGNAELIAHKLNELHAQLTAQ